MKLNMEPAGLMQIYSLLWLFGKNQSCTESISLWQVQIREGCPPAALALQTSVGFHRVIGHSKALCKAIHYTPAAPRVPWQIAHPFNHWSVPCHGSASVFCFVYKHSPSLSAQSPSAWDTNLGSQCWYLWCFNISHYSVRSCVLIAFCSSDSIPVLRHSVSKDSSF